MQITFVQPATAYRYRVAAVACALTSGFSAVVTVNTPAPGSVTITGGITANRTLHADTIYTLPGFVHVANGATLTIEPGTTILGDFNTVGSSLSVLRGARIVANGSADRPIVFTSSRPAGQRQPGDWGGLIIVGNVRSNRSGTVNVEGTGACTANCQPGQNYVVSYSGGTAAGDTESSGSLQHVRVEFAGLAPSDANELNSFTFAARSVAVPRSVTCSHLPAWTTRSSGSAARSTRSTSYRTNPATIISTCQRVTQAGCST